VIGASVDEALETAEKWIAERQLREPPDADDEGEEIEEM
jgi:hypothetical protein